MAESQLEFTRQPHDTFLLYHIFPVQNDFFLFDARSFACFKVSSCLMDVLSTFDNVSDADILERLQGKYPLLEIAKAIAEIKRAIHTGQLSDKDYDNCEIGGFSKLTIALAGECNLRCSYCFEKTDIIQQHSRTMNRQIIDAAVKYLFKYSSGSRVELSFYGGEPLLNFPGLIRATKLAKSLAKETNKQLNMSCITNGTIINQKHARFFAENDIFVQVSCDGPDEMHDSARIFPGGHATSKAVHAGIAALKSAGSHYGLMATIGRHNFDIYRVCKHLNEIAPFDYSISSELANYRSKEIEQLKATLGGIEHLWFLKDDLSIPKHIEKLKLRIRNGPNLWYGCGAGICEFTIDVDGMVWACERFAGEAGPNIIDALKDEIIPTDLYDGFIIDVDSRDECRKCWAKHLCGGGCKHNALESSSSGSTSKLHCELFRSEAEIVLQQIVSYSFPQTKPGADCSLDQAVSN